MRNLRYRRWWLAVGWLLVAVVVWLSLTSRPPAVGLGLGDKWGHVLAYFVLMSWFSGVVDARVRLSVGLALMGLGIGLEFLQGAIGLRVFELWDMAANALGVALGWLGAGLGLAGWGDWVEARVLRVGRAGGG